MVPAINYSNNQAFVKSSDSGPQDARFYKFGLDCPERDVMCRSLAHGLLEDHSFFSFFVNILYIVK